MIAYQQWRLQLGDRGVLSPGHWLWLRATAWNALLFMMVAFIFFAVIMLLPWLHLPTSWPMTVGLFGPVLAFAVYALAVRTGERRLPREITPTSTTIYELVVGSLTGFSMLVATLGLLWALGLYHVRAGQPRDWFSFLVFNSYISGMLEEIAFRAIALRLFARAFGLRWGLVLSSLAFGAAHLSHASWLASAEIAFNGGLTMGLLYMATGRLWMSIAMHTAWDFTEGYVLGVGNTHGLLLSTPVNGRPAYLTGGSFGPDGSVLAALVGAIFVAVILYINGTWHRAGSTHNTTFLHDTHTKESI
jgi:membrane protease YdiL (CAAX protease family)